MKKSLGRKATALVVAVVLFIDGPASAAAEAAFWKERQESLAKARGSSTLQVAGLPAGGVPIPLVTRSLPGAAIPSRRALAGLPAPLAQIPAALGEVKSYAPAASPKAPLVALIQDVHGEASAQRNIAGILECLSPAGDGLLLVGLEGAAGAFALERYRRLPFKKALGEAAELLLNAGLITGAEFHGLKAERTPLLWGIETPALYMENVEAYRAGQKTLEEARRRTASLAAALRPLKEKSWPEPLRTLDRDIDRYHRGELPLSGFLRSLARAGGTARFPQTRAFLRALDLEDSLDFGRVQAQQREIAGILAARLPPTALERLSAWGTALRLGNASRGDFYRALKELLTSAGIAPNARPDFDAYVRYVLAAEAVSPDGLFDEIERLQESAAAALARTPEQKRIFQWQADLRLLEKMASHELTPAEWLRCSGRAEALRRLPADIQRTAGTPASGDAAPLPEAYADFYRAAARRDAALAENLARKMRGAGAGAAALVAGGFHTPGLERELKSRGFSVAVVTPRVGESKGVAEALKIFDGTRTPLERMLLGEKLLLNSANGLAAWPMVPDHARLARRTLSISRRAAAALLEEGRPAGVKRLGPNACEVTMGRTRYVVAISDGRPSPLPGGPHVEGPVFKGRISSERAMTIARRRPSRTVLAAASASRHLRHAAAHPGALATFAAAPASLRAASRIGRARPSHTPSAAWRRTLVVLAFLMGCSRSPICSEDAPYYCPSYDTPPALDGGPAPDGSVELIPFDAGRAGQGGIAGAGGTGGTGGSQGIAGAAGTAGTSGQGGVGGTGAPRPMEPMSDGGMPKEDVPPMPFDGGQAGQGGSAGAGAMGGMGGSPETAGMGGAAGASGQGGAGSEAPVCPIDGGVGGATLAPRPGDSSLELWGRMFHRVGNSVAIVDPSDPANVVYFRTPSLVNDLAGYETGTGQRAVYVANETGGIRVMDYTDGQAPVDVTPDQGLTTTSYVRNLQVVGDRLYAYEITTPAPSRRLLKIYSLADPMNPLLERTVELARVTSQASTVNSPRAMTAWGASKLLILYAHGEDSRGLEVVDISNPSAPIVEGSFPVPASYDQNLIVQEDAATLYVTNGYRLKRFDLTDLNAGPEYVNLYYGSMNTEINPGGPDLVIQERGPGETYLFTSLYGEPKFGIWRALPSGDFQLVRSVEVMYRGKPVTLKEIHVEGHKVYIDGEVSYWDEDSLRYIVKPYVEVRINLCDIHNAFLEDVVDLTNVVELGASAPAMIQNGWFYGWYSYVTYDSAPWAVSNELLSSKSLTPLPSGYTSSAIYDPDPRKGVDTVVRTHEFKPDGDVAYGLMPGKVAILSAPYLIHHGTLILSGYPTAAEGLSINGRRLLLVLESADGRLYLRSFDEAAASPTISPPPLASLDLGASSSMPDLLTELPEPAHVLARVSPTALQVFRADESGALFPVGEPLQVGGQGVVYKGKLYVAENDRLQIFDISDPARIAPLADEVFPGLDLENRPALTVQERDTGDGPQKLLFAVVGEDRLAVIDVTGEDAQLTGETSLRTAEQTDWGNLNVNSRVQASGKNVFVDIFYPSNPLPGSRRLRVNVQDESNPHINGNFFHAGENARAAMLWSAANLILTAFAGDAVPFLQALALGGALFYTSRGVLAVVNRRISARIQRQGLQTRENPDVRKRLSHAFPRQSVELQSFKDPNIAAETSSDGRVVSFARWLALDIKYENASGAELQGLRALQFLNVLQRELFLPFLIAHERARVFFGPFSGKVIYGLPAVPVALTLWAVLRAALAVLVLPVVFAWRLVPASWKMRAVSLASVIVLLACYDSHKMPPDGGTPGDFGSPRSGQMDRGDGVERLAGQAGADGSAGSAAAEGTAGMAGNQGGAGMEGMAGVGEDAPAAGSERSAGAAGSDGSAGASASEVAIPVVPDQQPPLDPEDLIFADPTGVVEIYKDDGVPASPLFPGTVKRARANPDSAVDGRNAWYHEYAVRKALGAEFIPATPLEPEGALYVRVKWDGAVFAPDDDDFHFLVVLVDESGVRHEVPIEFHRSKWRSKEIRKIKINLDALETDERIARIILEVPKEYVSDYGYIDIDGIIATMTDPQMASLVPGMPKGPLGWALGLGSAVLSWFFNKRRGLSRRRFLAGMAAAAAAVLTGRRLSSEAQNRPRLAPAWNRALERLPESDRKRVLALQPQVWTPKETAVPERLVGGEMILSQSHIIPQPDGTKKYLIVIPQLLTENEDLLTAVFIRQMNMFLTMEEREGESMYAVEVANVDRTLPMLERLLQDLEDPESRDKVRTYMDALGQVRSAAEGESRGRPRPPEPPVVARPSDPAPQAEELASPEIFQEPAPEPPQGKRPQPSLWSWSDAVFGLGILSLAGILLWRWRRTSRPSDGSKRGPGRMNLLLPLFLSLGLLSTIAKADTLAETLGRTSGLAQTTASREAVPPARSGFMPEPGRVLQDLYPDGRPAAREAGRQMWELLLLRGALSSGASDAVAAPDVDEFRRTLGTANLLLYTEDDLQALQGQQAALISLLKEAADRRAHGPAAARAALLLGAMASRLRPETSALQVDLAEETLEAARRRLGAGPWTAAQQEVFDTQVELARRRAALPPDLGPAAQLALARGPFAAGRAYWEQVGEEHGALPKGGVTHLVVDGSPEETRTRLEAWRKESPSKELDRLLAGWGKSVVLHRSGELPAGTIDEGGLFHARIFLRRAAPGLESSPIQVTSGGSRVDLAGLVAQITFWLTEELPLTLTSKEWESAAEAERILAVAA